MFSNTPRLLPVIVQRQVQRRRNQKHQDFVNRMVEKGYTAKQVRLLWNGICASRKIV